MSGKKFQYHRIVWSEHNTNIDIIVWLNELGNEGWELVSVINLHTIREFYFKRETP